MGRGPCFLLHPRVWNSPVTLEFDILVEKNGDILPPGPYKAPNKVGRQTLLCKLWAAQKCCPGPKAPLGGKYKFPKREGNPSEFNQVVKKPLLMSPPFPRPPDYSR